MTREEWTIARAQTRHAPEKVFEEIYNALWARLFSVALNYVRDRTIAQEIVQDVFVAIWTKRKAWKDISDITAFSLRSIRNRIYDHFDHQAVRDKFILHAGTLESRDVNSTQQQIEYEETLHIIDAEIDRLPDTTKKIFRLSRFDRFTNEQIAATLHLSVKAVEYHITQALKRLRLKLKYIGTILAILIALG